MHKNFVVCKNTYNMLWDVLGGVDTETAYMKDGQAFLWYPSRNTRGQTTSMKDKPSPGALLGMPEDRLHAGQTKPPPGVPFSGCQRTDYM